MVIILFIETPPYIWTGAIIPAMDKPSKGSVKKKCVLEYRRNENEKNRILGYPTLQSAVTPPRRRFFLHTQISVILQPLYRHLTAYRGLVKS
jgi:hypothetical protein